MPEMSTELSPLAIPNIRRFIAFRLLFNGRFYYPVFTVLFLDYGLSVSQFAMLNSVWALTIVCLEVPSGALADLMGRRKLLILSGWLMVLEMCLLAFAPRGYPGLLLMFFLFNRFLSGAAEAFASGADEALAYDSLKEAGLSDQWGRVLEIQMRVQSVGYIVVMIVGAAVYDPIFVRRLLHAVGWTIEVTQEDTLRLPVYLTLCMAVSTLVLTWRMEEEERPLLEECSASGFCAKSIRRAMRMTFDAARWILATPFALLTILAGLLFDHVIRMVITLNSQYYRVIGFPEAAFGLIGSGVAILGIFVPRLTRSLVRHASPRVNAMVMFGITLTGLVGMTFVLPLIGLLPVILLFGVMYAVNFSVSHYLNEIADSHQRATVLSFKGLSYNLAYGTIGIFYSILFALLRGTAGEVGPAGAVLTLQDAAFIKTLAWFPLYFLAAFGVLALFARKSGFTAKAQRAQR